MGGFRFPRRAWRDRFPNFRQGRRLNIRSRFRNCRREKGVVSSLS
jgi:hypothetical protein